MQFRRGCGTTIDATVHHLGQALKPVILLVDDEADLVEVLQDAIQVCLPDYRAVASTSADEAEASLQTLASDEELSLVCVDHRLGGRNGLDLLETLRPRYPNVPSILFTGQATPNDEARAYAVGARVLWKPLRLSSWIEQIEQLLTPA
ncbi:MAG: response regulator [Myxococcota bacterium]